MSQAREVTAPQITLQDFKPETVRGIPGYFRVGQTRAGQWWLIDPRDGAFFSRGVNGVNRSGAVGGRPAAPGPYAAAVETRYGAADPQDFVETVLVRLHAWRCNTLGAWTGPEFCDRGMADLELLDFGRVRPDLMIRDAGARVPDVFDPRWVEACDRRAEERCARRALSRDLIGYFTDHALNWAQPDGENGFDPEGTVRVERPTLLQICLSLEPSFPAYHAAWEFTLAAHSGELSALARAWDAELPNKEALRQLTRAEVALVSPGYRRDQERFAREFARRYFSVTAAAIRRHDPHHLVLGCRFDGGPGAAILAECAAPHVDVVSVNEMRETLWERIEASHEAQGMPVLAGEFGWTGGAFTGPGRAGEPVGQTTVERMLARGRAAFERAMNHPAWVGTAWPRWADVGDRVPPFAEGLVHVDDGEAREHTELLTDLQGRIGPRRALLAAAENLGEESA